MLDVWNEQLAEYGVKIMKKRQNFINKLQKWAENIHAGITNGAKSLRHSYTALRLIRMHCEDETVLFNNLW